MRSKPNGREKETMFDPQEQALAAKEYQEDFEDEQAALSEIEAERRNEEWFEERGMGGFDLQEDMFHSPDDPIWQF
jgi:hypothetical protein